MLTDLADVCRAAGLKVVETKGWRSRGHGPMVDVRTIVCHHTAGPARGNMPSLTTVITGRSDLAGPLCHLGLGRDGTVYVVAAGLAYHAGEVRDPSYGNSHAIGIEAEGTGHDAWPRAQMDAYARLCRALCDHYNLGADRVLGHKEVCAPVGRKSDPNFDMADLRSAISTSTSRRAIVKRPNASHDQRVADLDALEHAAQQARYDFPEDGPVFAELGEVLRKVRAVRTRLGD